MERKWGDVKHSRTRLLKIPLPPLSYHNRKKDDDNNNYQSKTSNLNTGLEFKVDELKFAKLKV